MNGHTAGVIERAFQLAEQSATIEEIRTRLRREGYSNVDAHLMGRKIRSDLVKIIRKTAEDSVSLPSLAPTPCRAA
jgi:hypothetical protein